MPTQKKKRIPIDNKLYLFPPSPRDVANIVRHLQDKDIYDKTIQIPYPYTEKDGKEFINFARDKADTFQQIMEWGIFFGHDNLIGVIGFLGKSKDNPHCEELGYWLGKPYWSQGIMTKVLNKMTQMAFEEYKFKHLELKIFSFNAASGRVAEKCGYQLEKILLQEGRKDGRLVDVKLYGKSNEKI